MIIYNSPVGKLLIKGDGEHITDVAFLDGDAPSPEGEPALNPVLKECIKQLDDYFAGKLKEFTVPFNPDGTPFRMKVWKQLQKIPYGETITYKQLAESAGNARASRAVGGANHHNPIVIIIPCHRVIGADGTLTGYGGGLDKKEFLLEHERRNAGTHA